MQFYTEELTVSTDAAEDIRAMTDEVAAIVDASGITQGSCLVHVLHTTASVTVNEDDEPLFNDFFDTISDLVPRDADYAHNEQHSDDNANAHILSMLVGNACTVPVIDGTLALGTWQDILFIEMDGPQDRTAIVQVRGE